MATETVTPELQAAGRILWAIAEELNAARLVGHAAQAGSLEDHSNALDCVLALISQIGATADRAAKACGSHRVMSPDDWLLSPTARDAFLALERHRSAGADAAAS